MNSNPTYPCFYELKRYVDRLENIIGPYGEIRNANNLPDVCASVASQISMGQSAYSNVNQAVMDSAKALKERFIEDERKKGEVERLGLLTELSLELDAIRAVLPALAAKASIEIGLVARDIQND